MLAQVSDWRTVSGGRVDPIDANPFGLDGKQAAAAYDSGVRGYFKITDKSPRPASIRTRSCCHSDRSAFPRTTPGITSG